jgi:hypothetical protein
MHRSAWHATLAASRSTASCSPLQPVMLYHPGKIAAFGRLTLARGIAAVVVGFPATPLLTSRARICISAAHTREDLDRAIAALQEVAEECALNYNVSRRLFVRLQCCLSDSDWLSQLLQGHAADVFHHTSERGHAHDAGTPAA